MEIKMPNFGHVVAYVIGAVVGGALIRIGWEVGGRIWAML